MSFQSRKAARDQRLGKSHVQRAAAASAESAAVPAGKDSAGGSTSSQPAIDMPVTRTDVEIDTDDMAKLNLSDSLPSTLTRPAPPASEPRATPQRETTESDDALLYASELEGSPLDVRVAAGRGRGLYATQAIAAGSTPLRATPTVAVLSNSKLTTHCSNCHLPKKVLRCASCKALHYCSSTCQMADWAAHKPECAALKRLRTMWAGVYPAKAARGDDLSWVMSEGVRALGRLCWGRRAARDAQGWDPAWWLRVAAMEAHTKTLPGRTVMQHARQIQQLRHYLSAAYPSSTPDVLHPVDVGAFGFTTPADVVHLASAFAVNSFTLATPDLTPVGVATAPTVALCNHACEPNAVVVFPLGGRDMRVVALRDIAPGEELLTSYIDVSMPFAERQADLAQRYGFKCACSLCVKGEHWVDPRWSVKHPGCKATAEPMLGETSAWPQSCGPMPDMRHTGVATVECNCGESFTVDVPALRKNIEAAKLVLQADEAGTLDRTTTLPLLSTLTPKLAAALPPSAFPLLPLVRVHALLLTPPASTQDWTWSNALLSAAARGAHDAHPPNHPTVGIVLAEKAQMLTVDPQALPTGTAGDEAVKRRTLSEEGREAEVRQLSLAVRALREAIEACDKGFGAGGDVAADLRRALSGAEAELDMLRRQG